MELKNQLYTALLAGLSLVALGGLFIAPTTSQANDDLQQKMHNPENWASWGGDYQGTRYSELDQINADNVKDLEVVWQVPIDVEGGYEGGPLVIGDTIYIHSPFPTKIIALDQHDRSVKWTYQSKLKPEDIPRCITYDYTCYYHANQGLAYGEGKIFLNDADTTLVALDAETGETLWRVKNGDTKLGASAKSAPLVVNDKVIVGINGDSYGLRGYITAYYIKDGTLAWRGYSMGPDSDMLVDPEQTKTWTNGNMQSVGKNSSTDSWQDEQWQIGGGSPSGWITFDPELNLIYYGTGAPAPAHPLQRPGDNRWSSSLFARDADTGLVKWVYQITPHNQWDYKATNESILIDQEINGTQRKTLVHFDHNGFAYVLDRQTGELLKADNFADADWATEVDLLSGRPVLLVDKNHPPEISKEKITLTDRTVKRGETCPSKLGGKPPKPMAYSPQTKLIYSSVISQCGDYRMKKTDHQVMLVNMRTRAEQQIWNAAGTVGVSDGLYYEGGKYSFGLASDSRPKVELDWLQGRLTALQTDAAKTQWQAKERYPIVSGSLVTAGSLAAYGTQEGYFKIIDAQIGEELYQFKTPSGLIGNANTWQFNGKQYIGVLVGSGRSSYSLPTDCYAWVDSLGMNPAAHKLREDLCEQGRKGHFLLFGLPAMAKPNATNNN